MKKFHPCLLLLSLFVFNFSYSQVAINTTGNNANGSAMLDVESTTKGILIPRMTTAQRTAIGSPASGLLVYDNTTSSFWFYNGSAWTELVAGAAIGWKLTGNSGTDTSINFLGTTDNKDLKIRVNNTRAGVIGVNGNLFLGLISGSPNASGYSNAAYGSNALQGITTGFENTGIGSSSLYTNTTGFQNASIGVGSLYNNNGNGNTASGYQSLYSNQNGNVNTAQGYQSLFSNTSGHTNTAVGSYALYLNTTGHSNVAIGVDALSHNTIRNNLVAIGDSALFYNGTGAVNSTDAISNTAVGSKTLYANTTGSYNTAVGYNALHSNTTGYQNIADGTETLNENTTGSRNIAIGFRSLFNNTTAGENIAIGDFSMNANSIGSGNAAYGSSSLLLNTTGSYNTANGGYSLHQNTTGSGNTALGNSSLYYNTTGNENVSIGEDALGNNTTGNYNTALGTFANVSSGNLTNATAIGYKAMAGASNTLVLGSINGVNNANADVNVGIGTTNPTGRFHIKHDSYPVPTVLLEESENDFTRMRFINTNANSFWEMNALAQTSNTTARIEFWNSSAGTVTTPLVLYGNGNATLSGTLTQSSDIRLKKNIHPINNAVDAIKKLNGYSYNWKSSSMDNTLQMGVIAQEVQQVFPSLIKQDDKGMLSVNYSGLIPVLIEAIKEQQKEIDELKQILRK